MISNIIVYFAKYPHRDGVLKNFARQNPSGKAEYDALRAEIEALPPALLPGIKDYVVSTNIEVLAEKIRDVKDYFLLVEYGAVQSSRPQKAANRESEFTLAVAVGKPYSKSDTDTMEESLIMDTCLGYLVQIARQMTDDNNNTCPYLQWIEGSITIQPVEPILMFGCLGWQMTVNKLANDLI